MHLLMGIMIVDMIIMEERFITHNHLNPVVVDMLILMTIVRNTQGILTAAVETKIIPDLLAKRQIRQESLRQAQIVKDNLRQIKLLTEMRRTILHQADPIRRKVAIVRERLDLLHRTIRLQESLRQTQVAKDNLRQTKLLTEIRRTVLHQAEPIRRKVVIVRERLDLLLRTIRRQESLRQVQVVKDNLRQVKLLTEILLLAVVAPQQALRLLQVVREVLPKVVTTTVLKTAGQVVLHQEVDNKRL